MRNCIDKENKEWLIDVCEIISEDADLSNHNARLIIHNPDAPDCIEEVSGVTNGKIKDTNNYPAEVIEAAEEEIDAATAEYDKLMTETMNEIRELGPHDRVDAKVDNIDLLSRKQIYEARKTAIGELSAELLVGDLAVDIVDSVYESDFRKGFIMMDDCGNLEVDISCGDIDWYSDWRGEGNCISSFYNALDYAADCVATVTPAYQARLCDAWDSCYGKLSPENQCQYVKSWCKQFCPERLDSIMSEFEFNDKDPLDYCKMIDMFGDKLGSYIMRNCINARIKCGFFDMGFDVELASLLPCYSQNDIFRSNLNDTNSEDPYDYDDYDDDFDDFYCDLGLIEKFDRLFESKVENHPCNQKIKYDIQKAWDRDRIGKSEIRSRQDECAYNTTIGRISGWSYIREQNVYKPFKDSPIHALAREKEISR